MYFTSLNLFIFFLSLSISFYPLLWILNSNDVLCTLFAHCLLVEIIFLAFIFFCLFSSQMWKREEKVQKIKKNTFFIFALFLLCEWKRFKKMKKCWKIWFWPPSGLQNTCSLSKYTKISFSFCPFSFSFSPNFHLPIFLYSCPYLAFTRRDITTIWDLFLSSIKCIPKKRLKKFC